MLKDDSTGDPLTADLERRYRDLIAKKRRVASSHHCSLCGTRWSIGNTAFCLDCGTAFGACCLSHLKLTVHQVTLTFGDHGAAIRRRCPCGGRVG
jgi:hypothetical protein